MVPDDLLLEPGRPDLPADPGARGLLLKPGARLLHIGPHKTGTTAIQGAFDLARARLAAHGVVYAGAERQPLLAALAVTGQPALLGGAAARHNPLEEAGPRRPRGSQPACRREQ